MNKKLLAVAVAGTFLAPAAALAQSSVTISGKVHASFGEYHVSNRAAGSVGTSKETQVKDESSRIIFSVREDLGGGLAAIGKFDLRPSSSDNGVTGNTGESFVGLTSPSWGTLTMGKHDLHYGNHASFTGTHAGLMTNPIAVFDNARAYAAAGAAPATVAIANTTRTNNVVRYGSPKFGGMFEVNLAYSANATGASNASATAAAQNEADLRSTARKGSAFHLNPKIYGANWEAGYSYWTNKPDIFGGAGGATLAGTVTKQRGDALYGWYKWGGLRVGLAYNRSKVQATTAAGTSTGAAGIGPEATASNRTTWGLPVSYNWGNHNVYFDYYRAGNDKAAPAGFDTKARLLGLTYAYDLSKRTTASLSYTKINNASNAGYNLFTGNAGLLAGEDPRMIAVSLQHRY